MEEFELIVIGGGPAGYLAAERAAQGGISVVLFERNELGGVCLNEGCIPSKTLLNSAKVLDYANHSASYGVTVSESATINQPKVIERKTRVVRKLVAGVKLQLKNAGVTVVRASAVITAHSDNFTVSANGIEYTAPKLLYAGGSRPIIPPIEGVAEGIASGFVLTNREILNLTEIPSSLVVIGGGVIGLEMASYYSRVGSQVTVVEMLDKIGGNIDSEIATLLQGCMSKQGVKFALGAKVTAIGENSVSFVQQGETLTVDADKVLLSVGRRAVTDNVGLEGLGVEMERGAIVTNDKLETNIPNMYAAGDVNCKVMLAHTAYREAEVAVNNMLGIQDSMDYRHIPSVIYTAPEVGCVGETEESAIAKGINVRVAKLPVQYSGRFVAENINSDGLCKLIINRDSNTLVGAHILAPYSGEFIVAVSSLIDLGVDVERIKKLIFPHPTVCELVRETLFHTQD